PSLYPSVIEPKDKEKVRELLTFNELPSYEEVMSKAQALADIAVEHGVTKAMIGGALFFMTPLAAILRCRGVTPLFSFTKRMVEEKVLEDGTVEKKAVFKHEGWIVAF
ncbi:hypothetical protein J7J18_01715, partial [bacterium]|nr:hypothetical protein [bacterium]